MSGLVFTAGGKLMYYSPVTNVTHEQVCSDVTHQAASYLSETVRFDGEIHVNDVFSLLEANPLLLDVFAKLHAAAFLSEARKCSATPYSGEYDPDDIEYLELFYHKEIDAEAGGAVATQHLWLRAIGYELREDSQQNGIIEYTKGSRIHWSIMFLPVTDILNLPLRFNPDASPDVDEHDHNSHHGTRSNFPSLGQVISSLLQELSFHGGPMETAQWFDTLGKKIV